MGSDRIKQIVDASGKTQRAIAQAIGVHENTFYRYYSGERDMTLPLAEKMMDYLGMKPALLHNKTAVRPIMTGIDKIDKMLLDITDAVMGEHCPQGVDTAAHYFSDTFLCASPEYTYGGESNERIGDSAYVASDVDNYDWKQLKIDKNIHLRGVDREQEFKSYMMRRKAGHVASFEYVFAHLVDKKTICFMIQSTWSCTEHKHAPSNADQWKIRESYRSFDHLILQNSISQVLYDGAELVIDRKLWLPMSGDFKHV